MALPSTRLRRDRRGGYSVSGRGDLSCTCIPAEMCARVTEVFEKCAQRKYGIASNLSIYSLYILFSIVYMFQMFF